MGGHRHTCKQLAHAPTPHSTGAQAQGQALTHARCTRTEDTAATGGATAPRRRARKPRQLATQHGSVHTITHHAVQRNHPARRAARRGRREPEGSAARVHQRYGKPIGASRSARQFRASLEFCAIQPRCPSDFRLTSVAPASHRCLTFVNPSSYFCHTSVSPPSHLSHASLSPSSPDGFREIPTDD